MTVNATVDNYAQASVEKLGGEGALTGSNGHYTLDLGTISQGTGGHTVQLGVRNSASGPADLLSGTFSVTGDSAFSNTGLDAFGSVAAGQADGAPHIALSTANTGTFTETVTLNPTGSNASGYSGALAAETITITGKVVPGLAVAQVNTASPVDFGARLRLGAASGTQPISVSNAGATGAEALEASIVGVSGAATASGTISQLGAGQTDTADLTVGLDSSAAGVRSGNVTIGFVSDGSTSTTLPSQSVQVTGTVYREATSSVSAPANLVFHIGDPGLAHLSVQNTAAIDGFSEKLRATTTGVAGGLTGATGSTGLIAAGGTDGSDLSVSFSTAQAGTVSGSVTVDLQSDGTGTDGFATDELGTTAVAVSATVDNYAQAALEKLNGEGTLSESNGSYVLDLGTLGMGSGKHKVQLGYRTARADRRTCCPVSSPSPATAGSPIRACLVSPLIGAGQADQAPQISLDTSSGGGHVQRDHHAEPDRVECVGLFRRACSHHGDGQGHRRALSVRGSGRQLGQCACQCGRGTRNPDHLDRAKPRGRPDERAVDGSRVRGKRPGRVGSAADRHVQLRGHAAARPASHPHPDRELAQPQRLRLVLRRDQRRKRRVRGTGDGEQPLGRAHSHNGASRSEAKPVSHQHHGATHGVLSAADASFVDGQEHRTGRHLRPELGRQRLPLARPVARQQRHPAGVGAEPELPQPRRELYQHCHPHAAQGISGPYYILVKTDANNVVANEQSNLSVSAPIPVALTPPPDLSVAKITPPIQPFSGQDATVVWTVQNTGTGATPEASWTDTVYMSLDGQLDKDFVPLGSYKHTGALAPGQSYSGSTRYALISVPFWDWEIIMISGGGINGRLLTTSEPVEYGYSLLSVPIDALGNFVNVPGRNIRDVQGVLVPPDFRPAADGSDVPLRTMWPRRQPTPRIISSGRIF